MPVRSSSDDVGEDEERDILGSPSKSYKVEGDHTLDEPYIQVRPCFRITPLRLNDLELWPSLDEVVVTPGSQNHQSRICRGVRDPLDPPVDPVTQLHPGGSSVKYPEKYRRTAMGVCRA